MGPRRRGYLILLAVFLLGTLSGAGAAYAVYQERLAALVSDERSDARDQRRLEAFTRELGLNDDQRREVERITERYRPERDQKARAMFDGCGAPLLRVKEAMDSDIRKLLTPEQQLAFDAMNERRRKAFRGDK